MALLGRQAILACNLLDAIESLDNAQAFRRETAARESFLRFQRLVELAPDMGEAGDVRDALGRADLGVAVIAFGLQVAFVAVEKPCRDRRRA